MRIAIDTGGTFTDCVYRVDGQLHVLKLVSTPADPSKAILTALAHIVASHKSLSSIEIRHGTTVGTNAMLERKGARVAFVTTEGFEDTIAIGRQTRPRLYDWFAPVPDCLVPRGLRFGLPERVSAEGAILRSPSEEEMSALVNAVASGGAESIAVSLLFSFANPETEQRVAEALKPLGLPVSISHRILPEFREYERASTIAVNAYLAPKMQRYLGNLEQHVAEGFPGSRIDVMQSSGGILPAHLAAEEPVRTVLSGPAGGVVGACRLAQIAGFNKVIGFDMGGTSTDVFLSDAAAGGTRLTRESIVAGIPIGIPILDIHTVGAGGGSIARYDAGGMLRVGPESAGADPGPICFGRGIEPTVTDANLVLGRLDADSFLGGKVSLDRQRAEQILNDRKGSLASAEHFASGILRVVESHMEKAIRVISIERGFDPRDFTLVAFGGGGPLHACALASALRIPTVLVPSLPGALSAVGILLADAVRDYSRTVMLPGEVAANSANLLEATFVELEQRAEEEFAAEGLHGKAIRTLDLRYSKQGFELSIPYDAASPVRSIAEFHSLHQRLYGFSNPHKPIEIVNLRLRMVAAAEPYNPEEVNMHPGDGHAAFCDERPIYFDGDFHMSGLYRREKLAPGDTIHGPAMITEYTSSTLLPPFCTAVVDGFYNLIVKIGARRQA